MFTFIGQFFGFLLVVFLVVRYVAPFIRRMMAAQQDAVRRQLEESAAAAEKVQQADSEHARTLLREVAADGETADGRRFLPASLVFFRDGEGNLIQGRKLAVTGT